MDDQDLERHAVRQRPDPVAELRREVAALREELGVFLSCAEKVDCLARGLNMRLRDKWARGDR